MRAQSGWNTDGYRKELLHKERRPAFIQAMLVLAALNSPAICLPPCSLSLALGLIKPPHLPVCRERRLRSKGPGMESSRLSAR